MGEAQPHGTSDWQSRPGDMPPDVFRENAYSVADWIADYLAHPERVPVLSRVAPGDVVAALPQAPPEYGEPFDAILSDLDSIIVPGVTHWNHPGFLAYFASSGSAPGILAETLSAAFNANAMIWRTSPAATELEAVALDWLRQLVHLPDTFRGVIFDTASMSSLIALAAAREALGLDIRRLGTAGRRDLPPLCLYCSEQSHSSIEKGAITLGLGQDNVRKIGTDDEYRMDPQALEHAIESDIAAGRRPFCVVATVGTTSTTSIDPVPRIADIAQRHGLWLHVDAAYAGVAAIVPETRWIMEGVERADSVVLNPHKWLFTPIDLSAFYSPRLGVVRQAFSLQSEYLQEAEREPEVLNLMDFGPQLGRRFRALKLWFVLRTYGRKGLEARLRRHMEIARWFADQVEAARGWELLTPTRLGVVCFRYHPAGRTEEELSALNQAMEDAVNAGGEIYISHTILRGRLTLRLAVGNVRTDEQHVRRAWDLLQEAAQSAETGAAGRH